MLLKHSLAELQENGFCVLKRHYSAPVLNACRQAFWPALVQHVHSHPSNRGINRHFLPMPFEPPCFDSKFFFDDDVLGVVRCAMDDRVVADQWGCDVPLCGSVSQNFHVDYQRPLFAEVPDLALPTYMLIVSFGLIDITLAHGPIEVAPGTHRMVKSEATQAVDGGRIKLLAIPMEIGDVLIRHPWMLHRGTPNRTPMPRPLLTIRYVRRWYADESRDVNAIPRHVWQALSPEQRSMLRFPVLPA